MSDQIFWIVGIILLFVVIIFIDPTPSMDERIKEQLSDQIFWIVGIILLFVVIIFIDPTPSMDERIKEQWWEQVYCIKHYQDEIQRYIPGRCIKYFLK